jgi:hypothetical protein
MGGGHSTLSIAYGLGADRVLECEVVTPTGDHLYANDCINSDLFFALRGEGGGTFRVMMSLTCEALPQVTVQSCVYRAFFVFYRPIWALCSATLRLSIPEIQPSSKGSWNTTSKMLSTTLKQDTADTSTSTYDFSC